MFFYGGRLVDVALITGLTARGRNITGTLIVPPVISTAFDRFDVHGINANALQNGNFNRVEIRGRIAFIGANAFRNNNRLSTIVFFQTASPPILEHNAFSGISGFAVITPRRITSRYFNRTSATRTEFRRASIVACTSCNRRLCSCTSRIGDVNGDGNININDALAIMRHVDNVQRITSTTALNAARITWDSYSLRTVRRQDADDIMAFLVGNPSNVGMNRL